MHRSNALARLALLAQLVLGGCSADKPLNPSFPLTVAEAYAALHDMQETRKPMSRPLVFALGFADPGLGHVAMQRRFLRVLDMLDRSELRFITVRFVLDSTFDACRDQLIARVEETWPSSDPNDTIQVDVIGISMGGLVARHAALPRTDSGKRLNVRRLFTISTPHRGAALAAFPTLDRRVTDMRCGSEFLRRLDAASQDAEYELIPYVRLDDAIVGVANAAPAGQLAWWVANIPGHAAHLGAASDPRFIADIARRLRGEPPFTTEPPAPLPGHPSVASTTGQDGLPRLSSVPRRYSHGDTSRSRGNRTGPFLVQPSDA
jgi:pimeloyl-ACP methyl ester carboxylesterase